jgi:hypothetical protein
MKKFSILGLCLLAASALTAAFMPSKKPTVKANYNGHIVRPGGFTDCTLVASAATCSTVLTDGDGTNDTGAGTHGTTVDDDINVDNS